MSGKDRLAGATAEPARRAYPTVSKVQRHIAKLLEPATSAHPFWLRGELSSAKEHRGHLYFDVVETDGGRAVAKLRCLVWSADLERMRASMERAGVPLDLTDGHEIGIQCRLRYHALHGLTVQAIDIDPEVSLGALERRRREILGRLEREALLAVNSRLQPGPLPLRIGLITSQSSAGYRDFVHTLTASGYGFRVLVADASVQGQATEASVARALDCLDRLNVDVVALVRGGGSRIDLSHFDSEHIARRIAAMSVPVWTGIGHEIDRSVADEVAARAFKTPTAVAEEVADRVAGLEDWLATSHRRLLERADVQLAAMRRDLGNTAARFEHATARRLAREREHVSNRRVHLRDAPVARLRLERQHWQHHSERLTTGHRRSLVGRREHLQRLRRRFDEGRIVGHLRARRDDLEARVRLVRRTAIRALERRRLVLTRHRSQFLGARGRLAVARANLGEREKSLHKTSARLLARRREQVGGYRTRLEAARARSRDARTTLERLRAAFTPARVARRLDRERQRTRDSERALRAADPSRQLARGFALVYGPDGSPVARAGDLSPKMRLTTRFADGTATSTADHVELDDEH